MKAHLIDTHLQVPRSRSSANVKVKYQGHVSQKMGVSRALVFHKHILFVTVMDSEFSFDLIFCAVKKYFWDKNHFLTHYQMIKF